MAKLEEVGDAKSVEKARFVRNEVFLHLKRSYGNLKPAQRNILNDLKNDVRLCDVE